MLMLAQWHAAFRLRLYISVVFLAKDVHDAIVVKVDHSEKKIIRKQYAGKQTLI